MRRFLLVMVIAVITFTSCSDSRPTNRVRAHKAFYSLSTDRWSADNDVILRDVDAAYIKGDTILVSARAGLGSWYIVVDSVIKGGTK